MPSRFEKYRVKDGTTKLGEAFFNPVLQDIDLRISGLESLQIAWEVAVARVTQFGLARINEVIAPTSTELNTIRSEALAALADLQTALDTFEAAGLADILTWKNDVTTQISGLSTAVATAEYNATADIAAWKAIHLAEIASLISHVGNTSNPHTVTKAQVGLGNVNNTADADKPISTLVENALADKASTTHNHAGVYQPADPDLDAWAGKTAPSGTVVGTTDQQDLSGKTLVDANLSGNTTGSDGLLKRVMLQDTGWNYFNSGTTNALDFTKGSHQHWAPTASSNPTLTISNWPPSGAMGELLIEGVNLGAAGTIAFPTANWFKSDGTFAASPSAAGVTLQTSGTDFILFWTRDAGTTLYAKVIR